MYRAQGTKPNQIRNGQNSGCRVSIREYDSTTDQGNGYPSAKVPFVLLNAVCSADAFASQTGRRDGIRYPGGVPYIIEDLKM
jgi:hypothetical protein